MGKHGLLAKEIGSEFGLNPRQANFLLQRMGILKGEPGAWLFTEKGADYATEVTRDNGHGGRAEKTWSNLFYDPRILDEVTPDLIAEAKKAEATRRAQLALQRAQSEEADVRLHAFQEKQAKQDPATEWAKVLIGVGVLGYVAGVIVVNTCRPAFKRLVNGVAAPRFEAARRRLTHSARGREKQSEQENTIDEIE
ncbi:MULTISPECIES: hypothetical protein [unclassified Microbacterium]|uniref:hypothetical protein n=1 Tax=unclassified Microbacterium TaxID=2609290 RepID=UPI0010F62AA5|nr:MULTISPECIES: hypothetical protein [unclassified Microbacterium]